MRHAFLIAVLVLAGCSQCDPAVLLNAPPELHDARVVVDGKDVGTLSAKHSYRHGVYAATQEFGAPPRHEANLTIRSLSPGIHRLQIIAAGRPEYHATFRTRGAHTEVFIEDRVVQPAAAN